MSGYSFYCAGFVFGECIGVTDGDTIEVLRDHTAIKVRLEGIDCPERGQDFGQKAKQFTSGLVFGKAVEIRPIGEDRYGRKRPGLCWIPSHLLFYAGHLLLF